MKFIPAYSKQQGSAIIAMLITTLILAVTGTALVSLVARQYHQSVLQSRDETAFQVAESGLNYGRWRFAHNANDLSSTQQTVKDQLNGTLGTFNVTFTPVVGSSIIIITSTGQTAEAPTRSVTLKARYGIPSLAKYSSIVNSDVWYDGTIKGRIHANGGVRMDAISDNTVTSAKATYVCQPTHGCNNVTKPGVWGTGQNATLWQFPVPPIDYASLTQNLLNLKTIAQTAGKYWGPSGFFGYNIIFNADGTYSLYKVTQKTANIQSYAPDTGWQNSSYDIQTKTFIETKPVPDGGTMFFEDNLWVQGSIRNHITVAAGKFPDQAASNVDIIINGNITYDGVRDGSRIFGAIAQRNILIPYSGAQNNLQMDGAYIAQKGFFGRRYYSTGSYILRNSLNRFGMMASNLVPVTAWVNGSGTVISGYQSGQEEYDPNLLYFPPPNFPTSGQYEFISWEQQ